MHRSWRLPSAGPPCSSPARAGMHLIVGFCWPFRIIHPACAGMHPGRAACLPGSSASPRARGDEPERRDGTAEGNGFAPRVRGSSDARPTRPNRTAEWRRPSAYGVAPSPPQRDTTYDNVLALPIWPVHPRVRGVEVRERLGNDRPALRIRSDVQRRLLLGPLSPLVRGRIVAGRVGGAGTLGSLADRNSSRLPGAACRASSSAASLPVRWIAPIR